jgi:hypothetical protein
MFDYLPLLIESSMS